MTDSLSPDVPVSIELGSAVLQPDALSRLDSGGVVTLDRRVEDPVDLFVSGRLVARGELLIMDEQFAVRIVELIEHEVSQAS